MRLSRSDHVWELESENVMIIFQGYHLCHLCLGWPPPSPEAVRKMWKILTLTFDFGLWLYMTYNKFYPTNFFLTTDPPLTPLPAGTRKKIGICQNFLTWPYKTTLKMHFSASSQWSKICFGYQGIIFNGKKGLKRSAWPLFHSFFLTLPLDPCQRQACMPWSLIVLFSPMYRTGLPSPCSAQTESRLDRRKRKVCRGVQVYKCRDNCHCQFIILFVISE